VSATPAAPTDWFSLALGVDGDRAAELRRRRTETPVQCLAAFGPGGPETWVVYRHHDAAAVLVDERRFSLDLVEERYGAVLGRSMITLAPAARRALRRIIGKRLRSDSSYVAGVVDEVVAARVEAVATAACAQEAPAAGAAVPAATPDAASAEPVDLVPLLAAQVPARVIARLLGLPEGEWAAIAELAATAAHLLEQPRAALRAARSLRRRFASELRARAGGAADDLVGALNAARFDGRRLEPEEAVASLLLLAWAGTETTAPAIAGAVYALLAHPDQAAAVRADPRLAEAAVDEALRWESPVQVTSRRALVEVELASTVVPAGATVLVHIGAANRDERLFYRADDYDLARPERGRHLAFGHGPHRCLGWRLARAEVETCVRMLLDRFPCLALAASSPPPDGEVVRSPPRLLVYRW
jgi:cytochrome P450